MTPDKKHITEFYLTLLENNNNELNKIINEHSSKLEDLAPIINFILDRIETVSELTINNKLWDAEIILRSAVETFIKFLFIITVAPNERQKRLNEFCDDLGEIKALQYSEMAKNIFPILKESELANIALNASVLPIEQENEYKEKWTKSKRRKLEQKWSFTHMLKYLANDYHGISFNEFSVLFSSYRTASHLIHGDIFGILLVEDQKSRSDSNKENVRFGQKIRLLSDCLTYCAFIAVETAIFLEISPVFFIENVNKLNDIKDKVKKYQQEVFKNKMYDAFR